MTAPPIAGPPPVSPTTGSRRRLPPNRRNSELLMVLFAGVLVAWFAVAAHLALLESAGASALVMPVMFLFLALAGHMTVRYFAPYADPVVLPCVTLINGLGIAFIARLDLGDAEPGERQALATFGDYGFRQLLWTLVAVLAFIGILALVRDHRTLSTYAYTLALIGIVLVAIPAVLPYSLSGSGGSKLWIHTPVGSIQPGEFAKLLLLAFFAYYLVRKREVLSLASKRVLGIDFPRGRDLGPVIVVWVASLLVLVFERDLGTSLMYFGSFVAMTYVATERTSWLLIGLGLFLGGALLAYSLFSHFQIRVSVWLDPFQDPDGIGYQPIQALFGLGTGGLFGTGAGVGAAATSRPGSVRNSGCSDCPRCWCSTW
jgi:cell division protein FtsW (lipid II flippase)